ncbi:MAG: Hint domain-containing protein, partial [Pseudomonadota bacterium]
ADKSRCRACRTDAWPQARISYTHFMFDRHHVVRANGLLSESYFLSDIALSATGSHARNELISLFPSLGPAMADFGETAALCLKRHEAEMWRHYRAA